MHSDQIDIPPDLARRLIAEQFPQFAGQAVVPLATAGTTNAIFRIGHDHAARFPLQPMEADASKAALATEAAALARFHRHCPVPSPRPVGLGAPGAGYRMAWLVQTWVEGETATPDGLENSPDFARDLAGLVKTLRAADTGGRRFSGTGRGGELPPHDAWMEECFSKSAGLLDVPRLRRMWRAFRDLPSPGYLVMSHKDLIPANLLVRDGRLSGVLDGGGFGPADPALDLVAGWHLLDTERRTILRKALEVPDLEWRRGAAWAFQQAMGLVWYYKDTNPTMSALGRSTLSRLIADAAPDL